MTARSKGKSGGDSDVPITTTATAEGGSTDDYTEVDQGVDEVPNLSDQAADLNEAGEEGGGGGKKRGKKATKERESKSAKSLKERIRCSNCSNLMTQSEAMHYHELPRGKAKSPKGADGKDTFKGVGVAQGKLGGVLCDTCEAAMEKGVPVTIRTAVVERADTGEIENVPVADLLAAGAESV